jgi:CTP:molybdopterin cytidylyltransferase MocA
MSSCVIAAAGASSRMGQWKPLLPFAGSTVIQATVGAARAADLPVILVVGHRGEELAALFAGEPLVKVLLNPDWEDGQLGSVLLGVAAAEAPTVFLMNGDMPLVRPSTYRLLGEEWARRSAEGLPEAPLFAASGGRMGHPVLISRDAALGARALLDAKPRQVGGPRMKDHLRALSPVPVECSDEGVLLDIDTPDDYRRIAGFAGCALG